MAQKYEFLFIIPDSPDGSSKRDVVTDPHEAYVAQKKDHWLAGGPILTEHTSDEERGSWVLLHAHSREEAVDVVKSDPFMTARVWDWEKTQVLSVKSGLRVPFVKDSVQAAMDKAKN
ncbi:MAG: hypothetical protein Q9227_001191 [Pyrenula ochraceoflavens]